MPATRSANPQSTPSTAKRGVAAGSGIGVGKSPGATFPPETHGSFGNASYPAFGLGDGGEQLLGPLDPEILAIAEAVAQAEAAGASGRAGPSTPAPPPQTLEAAAAQDGVGADANGETIAQGASHDEVREGAREGQGEGEDEGEGMGVDQDDLHPALREIVNSLTNAQAQSGGDASAQQILDGGLEAHDDAELHATLANLGSHHFSSLFPHSFSHTEDSNFLLPDPGVAQGSSSSPHPQDLLTDLSPYDSASNAVGVDVGVEGAVDPALASLDSIDSVDPSSGPRRRGRPKGSKNKIQREPIRKPSPPPKPPKPPKEKKPPAKVGRPRKVRTAEEEAKFERRVAERKAGVQRPRGRPRIYPGHLVRELRLKENRGELWRLKREAWENGEQSADGIETANGGAEADGDGGGYAAEQAGQMEGMDEGYYGSNAATGDEGRRDGGIGDGGDGDGHMDNYDWSNDPQNLLQGLAQAGDIQPQEADQPDRQMEIMGAGAEGAERDLTDVLGLGRNHEDHAEMA